MQSETMFGGPAHPDRACMHKMGNGSPMSARVTQGGECGGEKKGWGKLGRMLMLIRQETGRIYLGRLEREQVTT